MADTIRTEAELIDDLFQDAQVAGSITAQDVRDLIVSIKTLNPELITGLSDPAHQEGLIFYDSEHKAVSYYNENSEVTINIGQELVLRVVNNTGGTITDGDVVYISGVDEHEAEITKAFASTATPTILGIATSEMAPSATGYITVFGLVHSVDTTNFTAGDTLYLAGSPAGSVTVTAPTLPIETWIVGTAIDSIVDGSVLVHPTRVNFSNETTAFTDVSHSATQTAAEINTAYPVAFNTSGFRENMTHSTTVNNSEITIDIAGVYSVTVGLQLATSTGASTISAWFQVDSGGSPAFVDVPNSAVRQDLSNNETRVLFLNTIGRWAAGDIGRVVWSTSNTAGELVAFDANAPVPAVPSVIMNVAKIGNE